MDQQIQDDANLIFFMGDWEPYRQTAFPIDGTEFHPFGTLSLITARKQKGWYLRALTLRIWGNCLLRDNGNLAEINSFCRPG